MKNLAAIFIVAVIVTIAVVDVYLIYNGGTAASISFQLISWSYEFPAFTFLMGFTMGHLFWKIRPVEGEKK
jgi:uncharacterized integral membrane protein